MTAPGLVHCGVMFSVPIPFIGAFVCCGSCFLRSAVKGFVGINRLRYDIQTGKYNKRKNDTKQNVMQVLPERQQVRSSGTTVKPMHSRVLIVFPVRSAAPTVPLVDLSALQLRSRGRRQMVNWTSNG